MLSKCRKHAPTSEFQLVATKPSTHGIWSMLSNHPAISSNWKKASDPILPPFFPKVTSTENISNRFKNSVDTHKHNNTIREKTMQRKFMRYLRESKHDGGAILAGDERSQVPPSPFNLFQVHRRRHFQRLSTSLRPTLICKRAKQRCI